MKRTHSTIGIPTGTPPGSSRAPQRNTIQPDPTPGPHTEPLVQDCRQQPSNHPTGPSLQALQQAQPSMNPTAPVPINHGNILVPVPVPTPSVAEQRHSAARQVLQDLQGSGHALPQTDKALRQCPPDPQALQKAREEVLLLAMVASIEEETIDQNGFEALLGRLLALNPDGWFKVEEGKLCGETTVNGESYEVHFDECIDTLARAVPSEAPMAGVHVSTVQDDEFNNLPNPCLIQLLTHPRLIRLHVGGLLLDPDDVKRWVGHATDSAIEELHVSDPSDGNAAPLISAMPRLKRLHISDLYTSRMETLTEALINKPLDLLKIGSDFSQINVWGFVENIVKHARPQQLKWTRVSLQVWGMQPGEIEAGMLTPDQVDTVHRWMGMLVESSCQTVDLTCSSTTALEKELQQCCMKDTPAALGLRTALRRRQEPLRLNIQVDHMGELNLVLQGLVPATLDTPDQAFSPSAEAGQFQCLSALGLTTFVCNPNMYSWHDESYSYSLVETMTAQTVGRVTELLQNSPRLTGVSVDLHFDDENLMVTDNKKQHQANERARHHSFRQGLNLGPLLRNPRWFPAGPPTLNYPQGLKLRLGISHHLQDRANTQILLQQWARFIPDVSNIVFDVSADAPRRGIHAGPLNRQHLVDSVERYQVLLQEEHVHAAGLPSPNQGSYEAIKATMARNAVPQT